MIRATLDVNVLASGFPSRKGVPAELIYRWGHTRFEMVLSDHILAGLAHVGEAELALGCRNGWATGVVEAPPRPSYASCCNSLLAPR